LFFSIAGGKTARSQVVEEGVVVLAISFKKRDPNPDISY
jgi:hypothetical protein